jgi:hypothetical protein
MGFGGGLTAGADFGTELFRSKDEKEGLGGRRVVAQSPDSLKVALRAPQKP